MAWLVAFSRSFGRGSFLQTGRRDECPRIVGGGLVNVTEVVVLVLAAFGAGIVLGLLAELTRVRG